MAEKEERADHPTPLHGDVNSQPPTPDGGEQGWAELQRDLLAGSPEISSGPQTPLSCLCWSELGGG